MAEEVSCVGNASYDIFAWLDRRRGVADRVGEPQRITGAVAVVDVNGCITCLLAVLGGVVIVQVDGGITPGAVMDVAVVAADDVQGACLAVLGGVVIVQVDGGIAPGAVTEVVVVAAADVQGAGGTTCPVCMSEGYQTLKPVENGLPKDEVPGGATKVPPVSSSIGLVNETPFATPGGTGCVPVYPIMSARLQPVTQLAGPKENVFVF